MSAFMLKIIALISMLCDHSSYVIFGGFSFLNYIGRLAFPIFAFQISEGYIHTKNLKKYILRLSIFALVSQIPFMLFRSEFFSSFALNVFFTLLFGLLGIIAFDFLNKMEFKNKYIHYFYNFLGLFSVAIFAFVSEFLHCDYGYFGVLVIFLFYIFKKNTLLMNLSFILATFIYFLKNLMQPQLFTIYFSLFMCTCFPLVFINMYNNKKGKDTKLFLYLFYPIHLLILYAIHVLL